MKNYNFFFKDIENVIFNSKNEIFCMNIYKYFDIATADTVRIEMILLVCMCKEHQNIYIFIQM